MKRNHPRQSTLAQFRATDARRGSDKRTCEPSPNAIHSAIRPMVSHSPRSESASVTSTLSLEAWFAF
jgi:hypothetical protein